MPPSTVAGIIFLAAALSPGLLYHQLLMRFFPRDSRSTVVELVELATVGALTSVLAGAAVLGAGEVVPALVSVNEVFGGSAILRSQAWSLLGSLLLALALSWGLAVLGGWLWIRRSSGRRGRIREGSAWASVLSGKRDGLPAYLAVELDDGRLIEGVFRAVSVAEDPARDVLALRRPIRICPPGGTERTEVDGEFVLIPRSIIKAVHGSYRLSKRVDESE